MLPLLLLAAPGCSRSGDGKAADTEQLVLDVQGMTCGSCEQAIQAEVGRLEGVKSVKASHKQGKAWVSYQRGAVSVETIRSTIDKLGYKTSLPAAGGAGAAGSK
jgi:copper chaperone CopZ